MFFFFVEGRSNVAIFMDTCNPTFMGQVTFFVVAMRGSSGSERKAKGEEKKKREAKEAVEREDVGVSPRGFSQ